MTGKPQVGFITGELADFTGAVRRVPGYAHRLMAAMSRTNKALDKLIGNSRLVRWLPFRVISTSDLNELVIAAGKAEVAARALAEVGYYMAVQDRSLTNPWEDKDGLSEQ